VNTPITVKAVELNAATAVRTCAGRLPIGSGRAHFAAGEAASNPLGLTHQLSFHVAPGAIDCSSL
jgi:hypothetical protein